MIKMKNLLLIALTSAVMIGCNETTEPAKTTAIAQKTKQTNTLNKNTIYLPDGTGITIAGHLINYTLTQNDKGNFDSYTFNFNGTIMNLEGSMFATLAKVGYRRKTIKEEPGLFVASYIKKGFPPVNVNYRDLSEKSKGKINTQARLVWKLDN
jgi:hypothetical protein